MTVASHRIALYLLITVLPLPLTSPALAQAELTRQSPLHQHILLLERERMAAYVTGDMESLTNSLAEEYLHTNLNGGTTDKAAELAFYSAPGFSLERGDVGSFTMHRYGDVVVATGEVTWVGARYHSAVLDGRFRVTRVYVERFGRWLLATSHASKAGN